MADPPCFTKPKDETSPPTAKWSGPGQESWPGEWWAEAWDGADADASAWETWHSGSSLAGESWEDMGHA